ncbi:unnamed protein product [Parnassius mnemosyne]|uniref:Integrase catalytic domain-containing protein n=1 Tax=Parnassius mnemosyne TaxID=213953 RepID=A0AAV1LRG1_9NEOP
MEECGDNPFTSTDDQVLSHDDKQCEEVFMTHTRNSEGNFVVNLPFKLPITSIGESKHISKQRFLSLERKFSKNKEFKQMYTQFMREFEQAGRMEKCTASDVPLNILPHHAIVNLEKPTTPLTSQATGNNAYYGRPTRSQSATSTTIYTVVLDYAGPFLLKDRHGHGYKTYKSYIAIFICSSTKAVHIELVTGLETHSFLSAFRRFIARRGKPRVVVSDNGTTFRGADRELRKLYDFLNTSSNELTTSCTEQGIVWKFVPSYSPHMNGLAEGAVKSCKYHLKRVLKQSLLTYEGFSTVLIQIEGIFNSRPLCPIPFSDSEVFQVLTPAHFLIGRTPVAIPDYQYDEVPTNRLKYFQQLQQIYQSFWKGFSRDYVGLLQQRGKWQSSKGPTLAAGSIVLIKDKHTPPCHWRLARIIETHPGGDGVTRVATLKTSQGSSIKLSFTKICPLPIQDNH